MPSSKKNNKAFDYAKSAITLFAISFFLFMSLCVLFYSYENGAQNYMFVFLIGIVLSSIELGSRYKDEPISVMICPPGMFYLVVNGALCCVGLFLLTTFKFKYSTPQNIDVTSNPISSTVSDIIYASLGTFVMMRSSVLKLGSENSQSQIELGLNILLKKLIDIIDRQVDRDQARRRSSDITKMLEQVSYISLWSKVKPFCFQVMQNVPEDEVKRVFTELHAIDASDEPVESKKLSIGLLLYNVVGKKLFYSILFDLKVHEESSNHEGEYGKSDSFEDSFGELLGQARVKSDT